MKSMRRFGLIAIAAAMICSVSCQAKDVGSINHEQTSVFDVGKAYTVEIVKESVFVQDVQYFIISKTAFEKIEALLPAEYRYRKQKFVCYDKKANNKRKFSLGKQDDADRSLVVETSIPIIDDEDAIERPAWEIMENGKFTS